MKKYWIFSLTKEKESLLYFHNTNSCKKIIKILTISWIFKFEAKVDTMWKIDGILILLIHDVDNFLLDEKRDFPYQLLMKFYPFSLFLWKYDWYWKFFFLLFLPFIQSLIKRAEKHKKMKESSTNSPLSKKIFNRIDFFTKEILSVTLMNKTCVLYDR